MKKFIIYLVVILVAVATGFTVFYLTRDNEKITISTSSIYMREGEEFKDLGIVWENKKAFSDYEVISSDSKVASFNKDTGVLKANGGGIATITFRTTSIKFRNLSCQVYVGNGTLSNPYYLSTAEQVRNIGVSKEVGGKTVVEFGLDKCYKLVSDINLINGYSGTAFWIPIGTGSANGFTGDFNGNGYTISNVSVDRDKYVETVSSIEKFEPEISGYNTYVNAGLFGLIGPNGNVRNLKINNIIIHGGYSYDGKSGNIGTVAGVNYGTIERVQVTGGHIDVTNSSNIGGLVGLNKSIDAVTKVEDENGNEVSDYVRFNAKVTRSSADVVMGITKETEPKVTGVMGNVGGLVGNNYGGTIIYSYSLGNVYLSDGAVAYGGIVGSNSYISYEESDAAKSKYLYPYSGAHVKDCYSVITLKNSQKLNPETFVGGVIGANYDRPALDLGDNGFEDVEKAGYVNKIIGNYYSKENLNYIDIVEDNKPEQGSPDEGQPETLEVISEFIGIGRNNNNGIDLPCANKQYFIEGKLNTDLKMVATYKSHENIELVYNFDKGEYDRISKEVAWKFADEVIWYITAGINNGYPYLNMATIEYTDGLEQISDGYTIRSFSDLAKMKLDGNYIITTDIDCSNNVWIPVGSLRAPFVGSLKGGAYVKNGETKYFAISNLKTSSVTELDKITLGEIEFAGMFGVTSGAKSGTIENVVLLNPIIANGVTSGGIVASNGYVKTSGKITQTVGGLSIVNCKVLGGTVRGTQSAGGIVGENYGSVSNCVVSENEDVDYNVIKTEIILYSSGAGSVGGIVGYNHSNANISGSRIAGASAVKAISGANKVAIVEVGGIAGHNYGKIENCNAINSNGISIVELKGSIGGIAGVNRGYISNVIASTDIYAPTTQDTYAGGIAGKTIDDSSITTALVRKAAVTGHNAGGIVGYVNYSKPNYNYNFTVDKNYNFTLGSADYDTLSKCGVEDTAVTGETSGGLAAIVDNGIIRNCYTRAIVNGVSNSSVKAGFVVDLNLTSKNVGIIINCYASVSFGSGNGKNYAVTPKEIFKNPLFNVGYETLKRDAGYCFNFVYNKDSGGTEPDTGNILGDLWDSWFNKDKLDSASTSEMKGTSPKKFTDRKFDANIWQFADGKLPEIRDINSIIASMGITFD